MQVGQKVIVKQGAPLFYEHRGCWKPVLTGGSSYEMEGVVVRFVAPLSNGKRPALVVVDCYHGGEIYGVGAEHVERPSP